MSQAPRTLLSIQYLRGLAALAVVAFHTGYTRTVIGAAGVDVFFVISGFIMVHVSRREAAPAAFLAARLLRVVPLYWFATLATLAIRPEPGSDLLTSLSFIPHLGLDGRDRPVVDQGWTLNFEMFFYAAFAVSLLASAQVRLRALTVGLGALVLIGVALHPVGIVASTYTSPMLLEFLAGAWLCRAWQTRRLPGAGLSLAMVAAGCVAFVIALHTMPGAERPFVWGIPALLIVAGGLGVETAGRLPRVPGLVSLGNASYALYLTHMLVIRPMLAVLKPYPAPLALAVTAGLCVVLALAVHRGLEVPISRLARWRHRDNPLPSNAQSPTRPAVPAG